MKQKKLRKAVLIAVGTMACFALSACKVNDSTSSENNSSSSSSSSSIPEEEGNDVVQLATPVIELDVDNGVTWEEVDNASGYIVNVNGTDLPMQESSYFEGYALAGTYEIKVKAVSDSVLFTNSEYSNTVTYTVAELLTIEKVQSVAYTIGGADKIKKGEDYSFTVSVNALYEGDYTVWVNDVEVTAIEGVYTIENVQENLTIEVRGLTIRRVGVSVDAMQGATVIGEDEVALGDDYSFTISLEEGYKMRVSIDGTILEAVDGTYTVAGVSKEFTIKVETALDVVQVRTESDLLAIDGNDLTSTFVLQNDITITSKGTIINSLIATLDLNGYSITRNAGFGEVIIHTIEETGVLKNGVFHITHADYNDGYNEGYLLNNNNGVVEDLEVYFTRTSLEGNSMSTIFNGGTGIYRNIVIYGSNTTDSTTFGVFGLLVHDSGARLRIENCIILGNIVKHPYGMFGFVETDWSAIDRVQNLGIYADIDAYSVSNYNTASFARNWKIDENNLPVMQLTLEAPTIVGGTNVVTWDAVYAATAYEVYVNGELAETVTGTEFSLADYADGAIYAITVKAVSDIKGVFASETSNVFNYSTHVTYEVAHINSSTATIVGEAVVKANTNYTFTVDKRMLNYCDYTVTVNGNVVEEVGGVYTVENVTTALNIVVTEAGKAVVNVTNEAELRAISGVGVVGKFVLQNDITVTGAGKVISELATTLDMNGYAIKVTRGTTTSAEDMTKDQLIGTITATGALKNGRIEYNYTVFDATVGHAGLIINGNVGLVEDVEIVANIRVAGDGNNLTGLLTGAGTYRNVVIRANNELGTQYWGVFRTYHDMMGTLENVLIIATNIELTTQKPEWDVTLGTIPATAVNSAMYVSETAAASYDVTSFVGNWKLNENGMPTMQLMLKAPVIAVENDVVAWNAVNAATAYEVYVNGELAETVTGTEFSLADYADGVIYAFTVKAVSDAKGVYASAMSNVVNYSSSVTYEVSHTNSSTATIVGEAVVKANMNYTFTVDKRMLNYCDYTVTVNGNVVEEVGGVYTVENVTTALNIVVTEAGKAVVNVTNEAELRAISGVTIVGKFVLQNDITVTGAGKVISELATTLDMNGYTIKVTRGTTTSAEDMTKDQLIGAITATGALKNGRIEYNYTVFDATIGHAGLIINGNEGLVENVEIVANLRVAGDNNNLTGLLTGAGTYRNVVIRANNELGTQYWGVFRTSYDIVTLENVLIIATNIELTTQKPEWGATLGTIPATAVNSAMYASEAAASGYDVTSFNATCWTINTTTGLPEIVSKSGN